MEQLRKTLLTYINSNEDVLKKFNKILRRLMVLTIACFCLVLLGFAVVIYIIKQPESATGVAMKNVEDLNKAILLQRKFNDADRQDIAQARAQYLELVKWTDSMRRERDSHKQK